MISTHLVQTYRGCLHVTIDRINHLVGDSIADTDIEVVVRSRIAWVVRKVKFLHLVKHALPNAHIFGGVPYVCHFSSWTMRSQILRHILRKELLCHA